MTHRTNILDNATNLPTCCVLCSHNCGLRVDIKDNKIVKIRPDATNPITKGYSCNKGYSIAHYVEHKQRVQTPLKKNDDGEFTEISWDQAIREIGQKLKQLQSEHGGNSIGLIGVGGQANHMDGPYALAFMRGLGSRWWFNALAQEKTQHALVDRWIFEAPTSVFFHADTAHSDFVLMMGTNPLLSNRGERASDMIKALATDKNRTLIVVDPRTTETAQRADVHLQINPGTDAYLMLGMIGHIINEKMMDENFVSSWVVGMESLSNRFSTIDIKKMARLAGIKVSELKEVAASYAAAKSASIFVDLGLEQSRYSTLTAYLMRVLALLTGNVGNRGGNVFLGIFGPDAPPADKVPFKAPVSGIEAIPMWAPFGMFSYNLAPEEILNDRPDRIRALIVEGSNPARQAAGSGKWRDAMEALELLVVIDPAMSETAQAADYVLPVACGYEKWEYAGFPKAFPEIFAHIRPPVVTGPVEALTEAEIYLRLAKETELINDLPASIQSLGKRAQSPLGAPILIGTLLIRALTKTRRLDELLPKLLFGLYESVGPHLKSPALVYIWFTCIGYAFTNRKDILRANPDARNIRNPLKLGLWLYQQLMDHPEGFHVANLDVSRNLQANIGRKSGKSRLDVPEMFAEIDRALTDTPAKNRSYPFVLDGGMRTHWNANTVQRDPAWRKGKGPHCMVLVNPEDSKKLGIKSGEQVRVESENGSVEIPLVADTSVLKGHIHIPNGFGLEYPIDKKGTLGTVGANVNELTGPSQRDRYTGCPHHKFVACRIIPA